MRGPGSVAVNRTRAVAGSPLAGSVTASVLTIRPSSSICRVIESPAYPTWPITTSTTIEVPCSTERGVSTRLSWMSRSKASRPRPTV